MSKVPPIQELRQKCQRVHSDDYSAQIVRSVSIYITSVFLHTRISANQISIGNCFLALLVGVCFLIGTPVSGVVGLLIFWLNTVLDGVDGEVARFHGASSLGGLYLDRFNSIFIYPSVFLGLSAMFSRSDDWVWGIIAAGVAVGFSGLRLAKTYIDATVVDALTSPGKAAQSCRVANSNGGSAGYTKVSEDLRSGGRGFAMKAVDFIVVRQPGFAIFLSFFVLAAALLGVAGSVWKVYVFTYLVFCVAGLAYAVTKFGKVGFIESQVEALLSGDQMGK